MGEMKIGFIITARLKSTRLKKKIILDLEGKEVIYWMIQRLKLSTDVSEIIIATSTDPQDDPLYDLSLRENINCFRGSEDDVLLRIHEAAKEYSIDLIVNITADCPLVSFDLIPQMIECYNDTNADLITTFDLPHGFFFYGIKPEALQKVIELKEDSDTEVWGDYFISSDRFKVVDMGIPKKYLRPNYRLSLDYPEDLEFFRSLYKEFGTAIYKASTMEVIEFLDDHPDIVKINEHCEQLYLDRINKQRKTIYK